MLNVIANYAKPNHTGLSSRFNFCKVNSSQTYLAGKYQDVSKKLAGFILSNMTSSLLTSTTQLLPGSPDVFSPLPVKVVLKWTANMKQSGIFQHLTFSAICWDIQFRANATDGCLSLSLSFVWPGSRRRKWPGRVLVVGHPNNLHLRQIGPIRMFSHRRCIGNTDNREITTFNT